MPSQEAKLRLIKVYLYRNVQELVEAKKAFFQILNLNENDFINKIMSDLIKRVTPYYLECLENQSTIERLNKYLKREIRIIMVSLRSKLGLSDFLDKGKDSEQKIKNLVDNYFSYIHPVFIPFERREDLIDIIGSAEELAAKHKIQLEAIFLHDNNYNMLLRRFYKDRDEIKKYFEKLLSPLKKDHYPQKAQNAFKEVIDGRLKEIYQSHY